MRWSGADSMSAPEAALDWSKPMQSSLASKLAKNIEEYASHLRAHPLLELAERGRFPPCGVATYLMNIRFLVEHTPRHLILARDRSLEFGQLELSAFFDKKLREEADHDVWAKDDLSLMNQLFGAEPLGGPSQHLRDLAHSLERVIIERPSLYLAHTLFVEYLMVLLGPIWLSALSEQCKIPNAALTVVSKHVELDEGHVVDELSEIDALLFGEAPLPYLDTLHCSMRYFELFCDELHHMFGRADSSPVAAE